MSFVGDLTARPPRLSFTNLRSGETVEMPFMPETLEEEIAVNYAMQSIVGMSHQAHQYAYTGNYGIKGLELFFRATTEAEAELIHDGRKFLFALTLSPRGVETVRDGAPPRILFFWPQLISMTCVLRNLRIRHEKFNRMGLSTVFRATVDLEEIRDVRLTSEDVRQLGTQRSGSGAEESSK